MRKKNNLKLKNNYILSLPLLRACLQGLCECKNMKHKKYHTEQLKRDKIDRTCYHDTGFSRHPTALA